MLNFFDFFGIIRIITDKLFVLVSIFELSKNYFLGTNTLRTRINKFTVGRPTIFFSVFYKKAGHRIKVNVTAYLEQLRIILNSDSFEITLKKWSHSIVQYIKIVAISIGQPEQEFCNALFGGLSEQKMEMIRHDAVRNNLG